MEWKAGLPGALILGNAGWEGDMGQMQQMPPMDMGQMMMQQPMSQNQWNAPPQQTFSSGSPDQSDEDHYSTYVQMVHLPLPPTAPPFPSGQCWGREGRGAKGESGKEKGGVCSAWKGVPR